MIGGLGVPELVIILIIALVIFGPRKLPEVGAAFGKALREFKKGTQEIKDEVESAARLEEKKEEEKKSAEVKSQASEEEKK